MSELTACPFTVHHARIHLEALREASRKGRREARRRRARLGRWLRIIRASQGMSQRHVRARLFHGFGITVSQQAIQSWEKGRALPLPEHLFKVLKVYGMNQQDASFRIITWAPGRCR